jgi:hypothetical protein
VLRALPVLALLTSPIISVTWSTLSTLSRIPTPVFATKAARFDPGHTQTRRINDVLQKKFPTSYKWRYSL